MNRFLTGLAVTLAVTFTLVGCKDDSLNPLPEVEEVPLILPVPSSDPQKRFLDRTTSRNSVAQLMNSGKTRPVFEFSFDLPNTRELKVDTVIMYKTYRSGGLTAPVFGPSIVVGRYTSFPVTFSQNSVQLFDKLQKLSGTDLISITPLNANGGYNNEFYNLVDPIGGAVIFTFEYVVEGGRHIILTPTTTVKYGTPEKTFKRISGTLTRAPYAAVAEIR